jgi:hypothetical protein
MIKETFGMDLAYYYYVIPDNAWEKLCLKVGMLLRSFSRINGIKDAVLEVFLEASLKYYHLQAERFSSNDAKNLSVSYPFFSFLTYGLIHA